MFPNSLDSEYTLERLTASVTQYKRRFGEFEPGPVAVAASASQVGDRVGEEVGDDERDTLSASARAYWSRVFSVRHCLTRWKERGGE